jgi:hypothetical protein
LSGVVNHPNFPDANAFVHAYAIVTTRTSIESDNYLLSWADAAPPDSVTPLAPASAATVW